MLTVTLEGQVETSAEDASGGRWTFHYLLTVRASCAATAAAAIRAAYLGFADWTLAGATRHTEDLYGLLTAMLLPQLAAFITNRLPASAPIELHEVSQRLEKLSWRWDQPPGRKL